MGASLRWWLLDQPRPLQARVPVLADDDVVVHGDAERCCDVDDRFGHLDVGLRRRGIAGGMVVHENHHTIEHPDFTEPLTWEALGEDCDWGR